MDVAKTTALLSVRQANNIRESSIRTAGLYWNERCKHHRGSDLDHLQRCELSALVSMPISPMAAIPIPDRSGDPALSGRRHCPSDDTFSCHYTVASYRTGRPRSLSSSSALAFRRTPRVPQRRPPAPSLNRVKNRSGDTNPHLALHTLKNVAAKLGCDGCTQIQPRRRAARGAHEEARPASTTTTRRDQHAMLATARKQTGLGPFY